MNRILLVEDEEIIRRLCTRVLTNAEQEVRAVGDVTSAMAAVAEGHLDLLITDIRLPDGNGLDVLDRFLNQFPHKTAIVITGWSAFEDRIKQLGDRIQCLYKPFEPRILCEAVKNALVANAGQQDAA